MPSGPDLIYPEKPKAPQTHQGEHHGDYGSGPVPITKHVKIYAFCAAINSCGIGFDVGVSTNLGPLIQDDFGLSDEEREIVIGAMNFFAMFGALSSQFFSDRFGRRTTFVLASFGFINGLLIMAMSQNYAQFFAGRALVGLGVGVGFAIDPLYISEISPARHRGELVTWSEIGINVGIVMGFSTGLLFAGLPEGHRWRAMCLFGIVFPVLMIILTFQVLPETPRWFVLNGRDNEARRVLYEIYPPGFNADLVIEDIKESLERERIAERVIGWSVICRPSPAIRRMLFLGILIAVAQQASGIDAVQYYLLDVMEDAGVNSEAVQSIMLIALGFVKLICILISSRLLDIKGRRFVLFLSLTGLIIALFLISLSFSIEILDPDATSARTIVAMTGLTLFLASYGIGLGPAGWLIPSEIFATCIRAKGVSIATFLNRATATLMVTSFLSIKNSITWQSFFMILASFSMFTLIMLYLYLPETKGRSLEDMSLYFAEETNDFSILDAERQLRVSSERKRMKDARAITDQSTRTV